MTPTERRRVVEELPSSMTEEYCMPEGAPHAQAELEKLRQELESRKNST